MISSYIKATRLQLWFDPLCIPKFHHASFLQVGDFKNLLRILAGDPRLIRNLRDVLKILDEGRWQELVHTVEASVLVDNRLRAFMCPAPSGELLLLFPCHQGRIDFRTPIGLYCPQGPENPGYVYAVATLFTVGFFAECSLHPLHSVHQASVLLCNRVGALMCPVPSGELLLHFPCHRGRIDSRTPLGLYCTQGPENLSYVYAESISGRP